MNAGDEPLANPLLDFAGLPRFSEIVPEDVAPAIDALLADARATIEQVAETIADPSWDRFVQPLADAEDRLDRAWGQVSHLNAVVNTPALREAYNTALPKVTAFYTERAQDPRLFAGYRTLAETATHEPSDPARRRHIDNALRDFRLAGAELPPPARTRFKAIEEELARSRRAEDNVLDDQRLRTVHRRRRLARGRTCRRDRRGGRRRRGGRQVGLEAHAAHALLPVLQYAADRNLRETLHRAFAVRASEFGNGTTPPDRRIVELRQGTRGSSACAASRTFPGAEDGAPGRGSCLPARSRRQSETASPSAICASCARSHARSSHCPRSPRGTSLTPPRNCAGPGTASRTRK
jgi:oligopeptidase A